MPQATYQSVTSSPRRVLVTGAAKRLGRDIALRLAQSGWQVAVHYRSSRDDALKTAAECSALTPGSAVFHADFADEAAVRALVPSVVQTLGGLDAIVNSASTFEHDDAQSFSYASFSTHALSPFALLQVFRDLQGIDPPPCTMLAIRGTSFQATRSAR